MEPAEAWFPTPDSFSAAVPLMLILSGCATGYQQKNIWDGLGYTDEKIGDGVYRLTYLANAITPPESTMKYWHARARELCGSGNYEHSAKLTMQKILPCTVIRTFGFLMSKEQ
jgi:hypothetical protein